MQENTFLSWHTTTLLELHTREYWLRDQLLPWEGPLLERIV